MLPFVGLLGCGIYVGWNIGANDAANCIGTTVGAGLLPYRWAALLTGVFAILGAVLQGDRVMTTLGRGIVTIELAPLAIVVILLAAGLFVTLATLRRLPVSTSQAIVGAIAGVGFAAEADVDLGKLLTIVQVWVVSPFLTGLSAFLLFHLFSLPSRWLRGFRAWDRMVAGLLVGSACYAAFSMGANNVGNSMGPLANLGLLTPRGLTLIGGLALALGALTFGRRVTETVGSSITTLDPFSASAAQTAMAVAVHFFSLLGIPVSTSQAVVGAVVGVGLVKGVRAIQRRKVVEIVVGWVATPTIAGLFSFGLYRLASLLL